MWKQLLRVAVVIAVLAGTALLLGACDAEGEIDVSLTLAEGSRPEAPESEAPEEAPPAEEAPPQEDAPSGEAAEGSAEDSSAPVWVYVLLGLVLVGLVAFLGARIGNRQPEDAPPPPPPPPPFLSVVAEAGALGRDTLPAASYQVLPSRALPTWPVDGFTA